VAEERQVGAIASFSALAQVTVLSRVRRAHEQSLLTVLFHLGNRTGSEAIEAIVMGARGGLNQYGVSLLLVRE
jgi:hypothetical protein